MDVLASVVNVEDLLKTIGASFVAALVVTTVASIGIWGGTRYVDLSQEGRVVAAAFALFAGALGLLATVATIALGIFLMVSK